MDARKTGLKTSPAAEPGGLLNRRALLMAPSLAAAALALPATAQPATAPADDEMPRPGGKTRAEYPISRHMSQLAGYMSEARNRPLPADVTEKAKWRVIDGFAAIVSGSQLAGGLAARNFARAYGGKPVATVCADNIRVGPIEAALANGVMGHADETDDYVTGPWHPGPNIIPTALAMGELLQIDGEHFLRAVALGYDVGSRVMHATGVHLDFIHPTNSMGGIFGATGTATCVAGFNEEQMRWALSYAAQQCSGVDSYLRDPHHIEKGFRTGGMGARAGVTAALLVKAGFTGVNDIFSGPANFFGAYAETAKPELLVRGLGERFLVTESNFKRWPSGGPTQLVADAMEALLKRQRIDPNQVREIVIRQNPDFVTDNSGPLDINVQHIVALTLVDGKFNFRNVHDLARGKDPAILRLRAMTRLQPWAAYGKTPTEAERRIPVIQITLADGTRFVQAEVEGPRGSSSNPYTREWVVQKARELMTPVLGEPSTNSLIERVLNLENLKDVREIGPLLRVKQPGGPPRLSEWPVRGSS